MVIGGTVGDQREGHSGLRRVNLENGEVTSLDDGRNIRSPKMVVLPRTKSTFIGMPAARSGVRLSRAVRLNPLSMRMSASASTWPSIKIRSTG